jgi:hypothetical protein
LTARTGALAGALVVAAATLAQAQAFGPDQAIRDQVRLESASARVAADWTSTALVGVAVLWPCLHDAAHRNLQCVKNEGLQVGLALANAELQKLVVHRRRPNLYDNKSWLSEHTSLACAAVLHTSAWMICPAVAFLRVEADQHWATDTAGGVIAAAVFTTITWGH